MRGARAVSGGRAVALAGLAGLALLGAGCHDLPDLGSCGNGIVEEGNGEACDDRGDSATCTASCELRCTADAAAASYVEVGTTGEGDDAHAVYCPGAQFQCGTDLICRAPSGAFASSGALLSFDVGGAPVLGDVDNDGLPDLIGTSPTQIYTRFASTSDASLEEVVVQDAPSADGPYAIFNRDLGLRDPTRSGMEIAIPTEGVAILRSDGQRFAPQLDLPITIPVAGLGLVVRDLDPQYGDVSIAVAGLRPDPKITVTRVPVKEPNMVDDAVPGASLPDCAAPGVGPWRTLFVKGAPDRRSFIVVTQRDPLGQPTPQPWHLCRYTQAAGAWSVAELDFAAPAPSSVALANLDGDTCLELAVRFDGAAGLSMLDAALPGCGFSAGLAAVPLRDAGLGLGLLAAGQILTSSATDELALEGGLYQMCAGPDCPSGAAPGTYVRVAQPTKVPWHAAATVDLNGDGVLDVVAARGGEPDVDVVRGGGASANVYRASTSAQISNLVAGDFDGDRVGDVAMVEVAGPGDRIVVLFGARDGIVGSPVAMTSPGGQLLLDRSSSAPWFASKRGDDGIDDLLVADVTVPGMVRAGLMLGDAARIMTSPNFPRTTPKGTLLKALLAGPFSMAGGNLELIALTDAQALLYDVARGAWSSELAIQPGLGPPVAALRDGGGGALGAVHGSGNQGSEIVVFAARGGVLSTCRVTTAGAVAGMHAVDIDGDGADEIAVQYGVGGRLLQVFAVTGASGCALTPALSGVVDNCIDLASAGGRLVALCRESDATPTNHVIAIERAPDGGFARGGEVAQVQGEGRSLTAGDFDGDGVPDLAVGVRRIDAVGVQLLRQCPAHDTRACVKR